MITGGIIGKEPSMIEGFYVTTSFMTYLTYTAN